MARIISTLYAAAIYGFIFLPVAVLVLFSFQGTLFPIPPFNGPSLRWYQAVLNDARLTDGLVNSLFVAVATSALATLLGFLSAWGFARFHLPASALLRGLIREKLAAFDARAELDAKVARGFGEPGPRRASGRRWWSSWMGQALAATATAMLVAVVLTLLSGWSYLRDTPRILSITSKRDQRL